MSSKGIFDINLVKIDDIVVTNARIDNNQKIVAVEKGKHVFHLTYQFEIAVSIEVKKLRLVFSCELQTFEKDKQTNIEVSGKFEICFFFVIDNLDEIIGQGPEFEITQDIAVTLSNIAYSTARGILFTRCQGTALKTFILPILPTSELIEMHNSTTKESRTITI